MKHATRSFGSCKFLSRFNPEFGGHGNENGPYAIDRPYYIVYTIDSIDYKRSCQWFGSRASRLTKNLRFDSR